MIFEHFAATRSIIAICEMLNAKGYTTKQIPLKNGGICGSISFAKNAVYRILRNRIYIGEIGNKGEWFPGEHTSIISKNLWARVVAAFDIESIQRSRRSRLRKNTSFLKGLLMEPMVTPSRPPAHERKMANFFVITSVTLPSPKATQTAHCHPCRPLYWKSWCWGAHNDSWPAQNFCCRYGKKWKGSNHRSTLTGFARS
ncbi:recombinase family protein [Endozoicomonas sp. ISHI1]|uniref:recombinase family protein n=1 Tax=Endozoicomonas sp. ISHI1 TaxID=2825882 RepID=UPI0035A18A47